MNFSRLSLSAVCAFALLNTSSAQENAPASPAAQSSAPSATTNVQATSAQFVIHGFVRAGSTPLPGVTVSASHSLTGKKVITSTDIDGSFRIVLPSKGRWVVRTDFTAFGPQTAEVMLNPSTPEQAQNFDLKLLSRTPATTDSGDQQVAMQRVPSALANGRGTQRLTVAGDESALSQSSGMSSDAAPAGASALATGGDALNQSVSVSGRSGMTQDLGLQNMDDLRERLDDMRARGQLPGNVGEFGGGPGGPGGPGGGPGGPGGPGGGGPGAFRMFRGKNALNSPHGTIYYSAGNGILDAAPYSIASRTQTKPDYGSNRFGGMIGGPLKIPHVYDDAGKTFVFAGYNGVRSTTPYDVFSHVPTVAERNGDFSQTTVNGQQVQLYNPATNALLGSQLPTGMISPTATALLKYIPLPNVSGSEQNYRFTSAADTNSDTMFLRLIHNFGQSSGREGPPMGGPMGGGPGMGGGGRHSRNNINFAINYQRNFADQLRPFATVGGFSRSNGYSANAGWNISKGKLSNNLRFNWNRSRADVSNFYAGVTDVAAMAGIGGVSNDPADWGLPGLTFSHYQSLSDIAPQQRDNQTMSLSDTVMWIHGTHHVHFGGDYRWIDNTIHTSSNARGTFTFTGSATSQWANGSPVQGTGYDFADFLLGYAQQTTLQYTSQKFEFLAPSWDLFLQDDWRVRGDLTIEAGLRYEYIAPFREAHNRLSNLDANSDFTAVAVVTPDEAGPYNGHYGSGLIHADRNNFAPRIGIAWKPMKNTVVRAGYGINYNLGQYSSIVSNLANQPPYAITQTNTASTPTALSLVNGFPGTTTQITNNYGIDPNYRLAYVQLWNLNIQRELTPSLVLNVGYTGSKGTALDMVRAPNRGPDGTILIGDAQPFLWETSQGSSIMHAMQLRVRKRMTHGLSAGATYTWSKSIDNASSIGGTSTVVAQNDRDLAAERGLSSFDQRHKLTGDWLYELPFGSGKKWLSNPSVASRILGDWTVQSSFTIASGTPFTARVLGSYTDVAQGVNGTLRANYNGEAIQIRDRTLTHWFNTAAFSVPASGQFGNAGRNTIIGPGTVLVNLALSRNMPIHETMGLELRAEASNVLNHPNFATIDTVVNSPTFGQVTGVGSMRKMTLSTNFRF